MTGKKQLKVFIFTIFLIHIFFTKNAVAGPTWQLSDNSWVKFSLLGQFHYSYMKDASDKEDFFLRRGRLIFSGQVMDGIKFFIETDNDNAGKNGSPSASTDIQDAFVDFRIPGTNHWFKAGLILLPFSFENSSSAATLLGLDYNSETIKFVNTFVWRDYGAELHGNFWDKLSYTLGFFDGYDSATANKNDNSDIRFTGHLAFNLLGEVETGWFYNQDRSGKSEYLDIGFGLDKQNNATLNETTGKINDSDAWVIDIQSSINLARNPLTINCAYYNWDNDVFDGKTAFIELGYKIVKIMPTFKYVLHAPDKSDNSMDYTFGLGYFLKNHNARIGLEYRFGNSSNWLLGGIQFLV